MMLPISDLDINVHSAPGVMSPSHHYKAAPPTSWVRVTISRCLVTWAVSGTRGTSAMVSRE